MRQIIYVSASSRPPGKADLDGILTSSRHNNAIDGISGVLWSDGSRFIQVLEGPEQSIEQTFARIRADDRHIDVMLLSDRLIESREFGSWCMILSEVDSEAYGTRLERLLMSAPNSVRVQFGDLVTAR